MKNFILILTLIFITSCYTFDFDKFECDCAVAQEEVNEFLHEAKLRNAKIRKKPLKIIYGGYIGKNVLGKTFYKEGIIRIDTTYSPDKSVLFHELGHYLLRRRHTEGEIEFEEKIVPSSIMSYKASIIMEENSDYLNEYYFDELFSH